QRLGTYLGSPSIATGFVITTMLLFSGAGSTFSERIPVSPRSHWFLFLLLPGVLLITLLLLNPILQMTAHLGLAARALVGLLIILPCSFLMGMPFPRGLRSLGAVAPGQAPWSWAINGCFSVLAAPLALLGALSLGYQAVFFMAALAYLLAGLVSAPWIRG
ncbi:MAG TPA: hypothetical protein VJ952_04825, partial [Opitutales bacterium]|nr:hypothetical protein [Opitutales bacterium]